MMPSNLPTSPICSPVRALLCVALSSAMAWMPSPLLAASVTANPEAKAGEASPSQPAPAAAPQTQAAEAPAAAEAQPASEASVGGSVALMRFTGDPEAAGTLRESVMTALVERGYEAKGIKRDIQEAAEKNKCETLDDACREKIGAYLNKNAKTPFRFFIYGEAASVGGEVHLTVYDIEQNKTVRELNATVLEGDFILSTVLPGVLGKAMADHQVAPAAMTDAEKQVLAELDEPKKSAEQIKEEEERIRQAMAEASKPAEEEAGFDGFQGPVADAEVDLKADFKSLCRTGPRNDERIQNEDGSVTVNRDLSPACNRGAFFGYWQPRAWVVGTLTVGLGLATLTSYGLALGARSKWKKAKDKLDGFDEIDPGDPNKLCDGSNCYDQLAADVVSESFRVRRFALTGDILLGGTALMAAILGLTIYMDRSAAKDFLKQKKGLNMANLRVAPTLDPLSGQVGAAAQFNF